MSCLRSAPIFGLCANALVAVSLLGLAACSGGSSSEPHDPVEAAEARNKRQIDQADITDKQRADAEFVVRATANALLEVELGKLAQSRASSPVVRTFGAKLVQAKLPLAQALQALGRAKNLAVPADLGRDEQEALHEVSTQTSPELEKRLLKLAEKAQKQDEDRFDDMQDDAYDGDIRGFAAKYLPAVREQLAATKEVRDEVNP